VTAYEVILCHTKSISDSYWTGVRPEKLIQLMRLADL
jgi:hypothetical protein